MRDVFIKELQEITSLLWVHIKDNPKKQYSCDERTYTRYLAAVDKAQKPRSTPIAVKPPIKESLVTESHMTESNTTEPHMTQHESLGKEPLAEVSSYQKKQTEKLLPKQHHVQAIDVSTIRKEIEALQGMPTLTKGSLYPEIHIPKTQRWAFIHHFAKASEKESFFQSVVKAVHEKLLLQTSTYAFSDTSLLEKLPMIAQEHDFLFCFIDQHLEQGFVHEIQNLIEPIQGSQIIQPFVILGKIHSKPMYSLILQPTTHDDVEIKKQLWKTLKLFHSQYT
jgi:hypothetical protein